MTSSPAPFTSPPAPLGPPIMQLHGIGKRFPGVIALDRVNLEVFPAEVIGLIGENGAGKSTLMKILGGVHQPDEGTIFFDGVPRPIGTVADAIKLGIAFIHQELNVLDNLDVAANVYLGREPLKGGPLRLIDRTKMFADTSVYLRKLGLDVAPWTKLGRLSIGQQQMVEIAKALSLKARIIIMDEPTSSLSLSETQRLFTVIKDLRAGGVSVIYISHRLGEVDHVADRVVALRDGKNAGFLSRSQIKHDNMVRLMVGRKLSELAARPETKKVPGYFRAEGLRTRAWPDQRVSFDVAGGEILGFAGLVGAGRSELATAIFGAAPALEGRMFLAGQPITVRTSRDAIRQGIYLAPEDRRIAGLITEMTIRENISLASMRRYSRFGWIDRRAEAAEADRQRVTLGIKAPTVESRVRNLSGGNQQKVVVGKWCSLGPKLMIFDEPTRGMDVGAKADIYRLMGDLAAAGVAILMISSDMEEILAVSDRVAVMHEGALTGILPREACGEEAIMELAVGGREASVA